MSLLELFCDVLLSFGMQVSIRSFARVKFQSFHKLMDWNFCLPWFSTSLTSQDFC